MIWLKQRLHLINGTKQDLNNSRPSSILFAPQKYDGDVQVLKSIILIKLYGIVAMQADKKIRQIEFGNRVT